MDPFLLVGGSAILAIAFVDLLWTSLWVTGSAGPLTARLSGLTWRVWRRLADGRHRALTVFGPLSLVAGIVVWSALLWAGWTLVFSSDPASVQDTRSGRPGGLHETLYFTGYALFTMGNGDISPAPGWRIPTVLMNASGIVLISLIVSYLVSVVAAVVRVRAFASSVTSLGSTPQLLLLSGWNGHDLNGLDALLLGYASSLEALAEQHAAYPVLRYYHAPDPSMAAPVAVALLDEALTVLDAVAEEQRPNPAVLASLRGAVSRYLDASHRTAKASRQPPPGPSVDALVRVSLDVSRERLDEILRERQERRARMALLLEGLGWSWPSGSATAASR